MKKYFLLIAVILFSLNISSCKKDEKTPTAESSYIKAKKLLNDKSYSEAAKEFEKIEDDFPFSKWAIRAQTMAAYAYYKDKNYNDVVRIVDDFIRINPSNDRSPYMMYMKSLSYYEQIPEITRAQDNTKLASSTFRELIARFPDSDYSYDARDKLNSVNEHLAGAKMAVGRTQIEHQNYVGAIKNFQEVTKRYSFTNQGPEAYYRLVEIYHKIGLRDEETKAYQQLQSHFPQSEWAQMADKVF